MQYIWPRVYINNTGQICKSNFTFREENPSRKRKEDQLEKRIVFEKLEYNKYELLIEKCRYIHKVLYDGN